jgi:hypothetical protein
MDAAARLRLEAGGNPHDKDLITLVGELDLNFEAVELPSEPELRLKIYTADPNTPTGDGLKLLAPWAATWAKDNSAARDAGAPR